MTKHIEVEPKLIINALKVSAWFRDIPDDIVQRIADFTQVAEYESGENIYGVKSERRHVFGVLDGHMKVSLVGDGGQFFSIIDLYDRFWFGESSLLDSQSSVIDVTAEKTSQIIIIPAIELRAIADQNPIIYRNLYYDKMRHVQLTYNMFASVLTYPLTARLSLRLLAMIDERGFHSSQGVCLNPAPTIAELARLAMGAEQRVEQIIQEWMVFEYIIHDPDNDQYFIPETSFFETEAVS